MISPAGPATHYELFARLRDAPVSYLVTGGVALVLHGVPRLTPDIDLVLDPAAANLGRLERLLAAWGYAATGAPAPAAGGATLRRHRHPSSALDEIDVVVATPDEFSRLRAGSTTVDLVDVRIPLLGADDLRALGQGTSGSRGREDAQALDVLASVRAGEHGCETDTLREQIRKFSRWSVAARLDWLLASARLRQGLAPEARPMTRGLVRRRPWTQRRG